MKLYQWVREWNYINELQNETMLNQVQLVHCWVMSDSLKLHGLCMPGFPVHHQLPDLIQTHVHQVSDVMQLSHPLLSPSLPTFDLFQHNGLYQWVSSSHQVAKVLEFRFSISTSNEYSELISFRMDCLDLLAVQGAYLIIWFSNYTYTRKISYIS